MSRVSTAICSAAIALTTAFTPLSPVLSAPLQLPTVETAAPLVEQVRIRRPFARGFYGPRFYRMGPYRGYRGAYGPRWRGYGGWGGYGPGWGAGAFIAGAIVGGMLAAPYYGGYPYRNYGSPYVNCNSWRQDCWR